MVGEGGLMLSGGQRQRIGIARALYKQSSVLIFDEATSALDSMTEKKIMNTISNLDKNLTIFIIAHRITTLKDCDQIIDLSNLGNAVVRKYNEIDH
jgi:ATP-binding cassette subfamily B protein